MSVELSHIAIACPQIETIAGKLRTLSLMVEKVHDVPTEKVKAAMVPVAVSEHFRIELLEPSAPDSPIARYLSKHASGGIHHLCFEVKGIERWQEVLMREGFEVLPPGVRKAARGRALFVHPRSFGGVLVELEEIDSAGE